MRCGAVDRAGTAATPPQTPPQMVVCPNPSNLDNGAAKRLEVVEDTTDVTLQGTGPVPIRHVADADRVAFVGSEGRYGVADVSVIEARDHVLSCTCANGCVLTTINVIEERHRPNCRVVISQTDSIGVVIPQRVITNGGVCNSINIEEQRVVAKSVVAVSVNVIEKRTGTDTIVVPPKGKTVREGVIK